MKAKLKKVFSTYTLFILSFLYFVIRIINLTKLPIFNDEAIYLDWGWKSIHSRKNLFYSLYDAKQPLLMWIFGIFENIFYDPLFAGRLVSVLAGYATILGIYFIGKKYFNQKVALLAFFIYIFLPIFSFYDRQALMESAIAAIGVWSFYLYLSLFNKKNLKKAIFLGIILGTGFFIKSSSLIFYFIIIILSLYFRACEYFEARKPACRPPAARLPAGRERAGRGRDGRHRLLETFQRIEGRMSLSAQRKKETGLELAKNLFISFLVAQVVLFPLYLQKNFWHAFPMNRRFVLTPGELIRFPFAIWTKNFLNLLEILFWYLTPFVFLIGMVGIFILLKNSDPKKKCLSLWFLITTLIVVFSTRKLGPRYIASFLPLITIFYSYTLLVFLKNKKKLFFLLLFFSMITPISLTVLQIFSPLDYFSIFSKLTRFSQKGEYVTGWTSGYGILEVRQLLLSKAEKDQILVGVRVDAGNPENAIFTYFSQSKNVTPIYLDAKTIPKDLSKYNCLQSRKPIYFVSRDTQLAGLGNFLEEIKRVYKPEGKSFIGVYQFKSNCGGETLFIFEARRPRLLAVDEAQENELASRA